MISDDNFLHRSVWATRRVIAKSLRKLANKVHDDTTWRTPGLVLRHVRGLGPRVSWQSDGAPGVLLWYMENEYDKSWTPEGDYYDE